MIERQVAEILSALHTAVIKHGPEALELALRVIRIEGAFDMLLGFASLVGLIIAIKSLLRYWKSDDCKEGEDVECVMRSLVGILAAFVLSIVVITSLTVRTWMAVIDPRLALAYDIMKRLKISP